MKLVQAQQKVQKGTSAPPAAPGGNKVHRFWSTQPVPQDGLEANNTVKKLDSLEGVNEEIETKEVKDVRAEPYTLPK